MQTIISTHSPHIVSNHPFENIRYMSLKNGENGNNIEIKNFYNELSKKYSGEKKEFYFLTQTSLDKGTQRKTTENELPSLTQCTA